MACVLTEERCQTEEFEELYSRLFIVIAKSLNSNVAMTSAASLDFEQQRLHFYAAAVYIYLFFEKEIPESFQLILKNKPEFLFTHLFDQSLLSILYAKGNLSKSLYFFIDECIQKLIGYPSINLSLLQTTLQGMVLIKHRSRDSYRNYSMERERWVTSLSMLIN
jgi:hypothetical protein